MSRQETTRSAPCGRGDALVRLRHAVKFLEVAQVVETEADSVPEAAGVAVSLAVLAGIAASDAACCARLGRRSRGQDHKQAARLLRFIDPGGAEASVQLDRLLGLKDAAHYGATDLSLGEVRASIRRASALVEFAKGVQGL